VRAIDATLWCFLVDSGWARRPSLPQYSGSRQASTVGCGVAQVLSSLFHWGCPSQQQCCTPQRRGAELFSLARERSVRRAVVSIKVAQFDSCALQFHSFLSEYTRPPRIYTQWSARCWQSSARLSWASKPLCRHCALLWLCWLVWIWPLLHCKYTLAFVSTILWTWRAKVSTLFSD